MELGIETIRQTLLRLRARMGGKDPAQKYAGDEPPLRSELFSAVQMEQHGHTLAGLHKLSPGRPQHRLLARLAENEAILLGVRTLLTEAVKADRRITPAGEWLLDNFYLIEEQIRTATRHLPKGYSKELPRLLDGPSAGLPRVYDIALETISHGDGRVDPESLTSFIAAYQRVSILKLGELWAIPIMLRLALIENLRRVGTRIAADRTGRNHADYWADRMTEVAGKDPKSLILVIADMARSNPPMVSSFVAEFARRLQGQGPALALPLTWIEQRLSESGLTIEQLVRAENQQQAADRVSMSNSIGSLRFLGAMDWRDIRRDDERCRTDPASRTLGTSMARWILPHGTATAMLWKRLRRTAGTPKARWRAKRSNRRSRVPSGKRAASVWRMWASTWSIKDWGSSSDWRRCAHQSLRPFENSAASILCRCMAARFC